MAVTINIPSQVKTYANLAAFPASGSLKTIYIAEDTNKTYRWDGSTYVEISASAATGLTVGTTPIASGTVGRVLFQGTGNVLQQSSSLAYDDSTKAFSIVANQNATTSLTLSNNSTGSSSLITSTLISDTAVGNSLLYGSGRVNNNVNQYQTGASYIIDYQGPVSLNLSSTFASGSNSGIRFWTASSTSNGVERMRIASTGNVLINTTTDAGFRLDVNGTARFVGRMTATGGLDLNASIQNFSNYQGYGQMQLFNGVQFQLYNASNTSWSAFSYATSTGLTLSINSANLSGVLNGLAINPSLVASANNNTLVGLDINPTFTNGAFTGVTQFFARFANTGGGTSLPATTGTSQTGGILRLGRDNAVLDIGSHSAGGAWFQSVNRNNLATNYNIFLNPNGGNILIGTTTDAGFRLDVNGTARFVAPNTYAITYDTNGNFNAAGAYSNFSLTNAAGSLRAKLNNDGPNGTLTLYQNATGYIFLNGAQSGNNSYIATALSIGNQSAANASSILELTSTTKGFLPPRMTTTQRNAIASPAAGLVVYDNTDNKHYGYNGTTWNAFY
jgi:hypothetical protein